MMSLPNEVVSCLTLGSLAQCGRGSIHTVVRNILFRAFEVGIYILCGSISQV